jgi:polar amino acid transport system substrate-binding protein
LRSSWSRLSAALLVLLTAALIVGCGSSNSSSSTTTSSSAASSSNTSSTPAASSGGNPTVTALVPAAIKSKGTLTVAADATYAPNEFIASDGHTVIGMDADLMKAIATAMGLKIKIVNATFDSIIPGLASGKYDVGASSFTDTKEREKTVDFVDYFTAGESFYTKASGGATINTIDDLCGHTVAVERGTTEQADANTQSKKCKAAGKAAVTVLPFADQNGANLALVSGRAQLGFADSPPAEYQVQKSNGQFKLVGQSYANAPYGLAIPKNSGLDKPIQAAILALMKNGQYKAILTHWGVEAGAIPASKVKINGAIS